MESININNGKSVGATNEFIHGMATLRINLTSQANQPPATVMHPSPGVDVAGYSMSARNYPQPAWQSSPTRPSSHTRGTEAIMPEQPGASTSSSPVGPKAKDNTTSSFTLPLLSWPPKPRSARRRQTRPIPQPFPGHYKPHRVRHRDNFKSITQIARARLSRYETHPPTTQQERNRYNTLLALATGTIDKHHPHQPLFDDHFHQRVSMKREINKHRKEQLMRDRLAGLAETRAKFAADQKHWTLVESSVEAFDGLSLTGAKAKSKAKEQSSVMAGENVKHAVGGAGGQVSDVGMEEESDSDEDLDWDGYPCVYEGKHATGEKGAQVATQEEESLEDLDVDEYLYLDEDFDGMEM